MTNFKIAFFSVLLTLVSTLEANSACIPHSVAEGAVEGRTYALKNSQNSKYPKYLTFGNSSDLKASYGSALDGHPGGEYHYRGNCHAEVIVTFTPAFGPNPAPIEVFRLRPLDHEYFQLRSENSDIFNIVTDS
jgi:hypothetical protein